MRKPECAYIINSFIEKLNQTGKYGIELYSKKPRIYNIDGKKVNIRCTTTKKLLYSVGLDVLPIVDCIIYLTSGPYKNSNYFLMFSSKYLKEIIDEMWPSYSKYQNLRLFEIDWEDSCCLKLKNRWLDVYKHAYDLIDSKYYPDFKNC